MSDALRWTRKAPSEEGWYWFEDYLGADFAALYWVTPQFPNEDGLCVHAFTLGGYDLAVPLVCKQCPNARWAGPLRPPQSEERE